MKKRTLRARLWVAALCSLCVQLSAAGEALAEDAACSVGDRPCGRRAFERATSAFDAQRYEEAARWYLAAQTAAPHPTLSFNLGLCYARSGQPSLGHAQFVKLLAEPLLDDDLRERARRELAAVDRRVARVSIEAGEGHGVVEWDGQIMEGQPEDWIVDPGAHHVRISGADGTVLDQDVRLEAGERLKLRLMNRTRALDLAALPRQSGPASSAQPGPATAMPAAPDGSTMRRGGLAPEWFYLAGGVTVLLGAATIWSGLDVENAYARYQDDAPKLTQAEADARVSDGHERELRTNVLLGATAASAVATTLLGVFWTNWHPEAGRPGVSMVVTPAGGGVHGTF